MNKLQLFAARVLAPRDETGATAVEYGLMVSLIAGAIVVAVGLLGQRVDAIFDGVRGAI